MQEDWCYLQNQVLKLLSQRCVQCCTVLRYRKEIEYKRKVILERLHTI